MNPKPFLSLSCYFLRLALIPIVVLSLVAASVATVSADPQRSTHKTKKVKYVIVVGSNIPVPVKDAKGLLPKTSVPIQTVTAKEMSEVGAFTPAEGLVRNVPGITITGR